MHMSEPLKLEAARKTWQDKIRILEKVLRFLFPSACTILLDKFSKVSEKGTVKSV